jgi:hypothetical protein
MKQCKCEHWQQCPTCMPHRFDEEGNLKPPEPTPLQAAKAEIESLKQRLFEMQNAAIDLAKQQFLTQEDLERRWGISGATLERDRSLKQGMRYLKIGGLIRYRLQDVLDYEAECTVETERRKK